MLNETDNTHRMYCSIGCNRTITNDYIGLTLLPNSLLLEGWNDRYDASKQKENAQRHYQSMHTIQVTQITVLLRCGITKTQKYKIKDISRTKRSSRDICSFINRAT